jgi:hypothetical protein
MSLPTVANEGTCQMRLITQMELGHSCDGPSEGQSFFAYSLKVPVDDDLGCECKDFMATEMRNKSENITKTEAFEKKLIILFLYPN